MSDADRAVEDAEQTVRVVAAEHKADEVAAFWHRLKEHRIPPAMRCEFTCQEFWPATAEVTVEWDDGE